LRHAQATRRHAGLFVSVMNIHPIACAYRHQKI